MLIEKIDYFCFMHSSTAHAEEHMLPCLWKQNFGFECFGCGFQRSLALVFQGEFAAAFQMYPAIYTLLLMFAILGLHLKLNLKYGHKILLGLFILNILIIVISYFIKHT